MERLLSVQHQRVNQKTVDSLLARGLPQYPQLPLHDEHHCARLSLSVHHTILLAAIHLLRVFRVWLDSSEGLESRLVHNSAHLSITLLVLLVFDQVTRNSSFLLNNLVDGALQQEATRLHVNLLIVAENANLAELIQKLPGISPFFLNKGTRHLEKSLFVQEQKCTRQDDLPQLEQQVFVLHHELTQLRHVYFVDLSHHEVVSEVDHFCQVCKLGQNVLQADDLARCELLAVPDHLSLLLLGFLAEHFQAFLLLLGKLLNQFPVAQAKLSVEAICAEVLLELFVDGTAGDEVHSVVLERDLLLVSEKRFSNVHAVLPWDDESRRLYQETIACGLDASHCDI